MERLGRFAEQTTPVFTDLKVAAPGINKAFTQLPGFSNSSTKFFKSLGQTSKVSGPALVGDRAAAGAPESPRRGRQAVLHQPRRRCSAASAKRGGLERLLDFIFLGAGAANGYDALGHFLRTEGVGTSCLKYYVQPNSGCTRKLSRQRRVPRGDRRRPRRAQANRATW